MHSLTSLLPRTLATAATEEHGLPSRERAPAVQALHSESHARKRS
jgi:hypothetical protein